VASGRADCGLGVRAAAKALGLDFILVASEPYQLVIPTRFFEHALLHPLRQLMEDENFHHAVEGLPGYDVRAMGQIVAQYPGVG